MMLNKIIFAVVIGLTAIALVIGATSCTSTKDTMTGCIAKHERKSLKHIRKALVCPAAFAPTCAALFPGKDSTHETVTFKRDTMVLSDTVTNYDSITHTWTTIITKEKTITITVNHWFYVQKTNTAALEAEKQKTRSAEIKAVKDLAKQKTWLNICMWGFIICGGACIVMLIKWIVTSKLIK